MITPKYFIISLCVGTFILNSCRNDKGIPDYNEYPDEIGKIIFTKCATPGCHNDASKEAAGGLSLASWEKLFEGGRNSAAVIPFRSDYSTLFYYTNTYSDLGVTLSPTMPYNQGHLTREEIVLIKNWIDNGAPNRNDFVKFSDNPNRKKFYVTNQGCDVVTVFDQATLLPMRYINVGSSGSIESPHMIKVSPDKQYWYVLSLAGTQLKKYRTADDSFVASATIGPGYWNAFTISGDSKTAYCTDLSPITGKIAMVNLSTMAVNVQIGFNYPHGCALNNSNDTLYVTQQIGSSKLYKVPVADFSAYSEINLFSTPPALPLNPHEVVFSPDGSKYFVTCQGTSEVRVFQSGTDQLLATIPVGASPTEMSFSPATNYLFVSCTEDTLNFPGKRGSVAVIDYQNNQFIQFIYTGHQPHGIAVDESKGLVIVVNRNFASDGPAPHHSGECGGRNGYTTFIDLSTLSVLKSGNSTKRIEIAVDPYSVSVRN